MNNTHLNRLIAILLCANASIPSLVNAKSKELAKRIVAITANTCIQAEKPLLASKTCAAESSEESIKLAAARRLLNQATENNLASILCEKDNYKLLNYLFSNDSNAAFRLSSLVTKKNFTAIAKSFWAPLAFLAIDRKKSKSNLTFYFFRH